MFFLFLFAGRALLKRVLKHFKIKRPAYAGRNYCRTV